MYLRFQGIKAKRFKSGELTKSEHGIIHVIKNGAYCDYGGGYKMVTGVS